MIGMADQDSLPTAVISLRIMEALANADGELGVSELARQLDYPKARIHRHLTGLREHGYVTQAARSTRYTIGWRLYLLGQQLVRRFDVLAIARPLMEQLRDEVGQTVVITTFSEREVIVLDFVPGRSPLEIGLRPGTRFPFNTVAQGKVVLAFGPATILASVLERPLESSTSHTITDADRLAVEIELVRKRGWADAPEEIFTGINAIAAPIFRDDGKLFGSLALVGSVHYLSNPPAPEMVASLSSAASRISQALGHPPSVSLNLHAKA